ncbi:hypothetical protein BOX15_Mlig011102g1 [Macrostomum lignano]|uniref:Uncharacterized protein n=1 Tax=Macrostomum lignano TaxID=282301 RepID=A0A267EGF1_9PLAT|nr:hypothetical protein BOX15_Mlig011102g1 [Macrostomum lignano]
MYHNEMGRPLMAKETAETLLRHHPDHMKGHLLLGDIHLNHLKDVSGAAAYFYKAHQLDPTSPQALHNLCVTMVESGRLREAEQCLARAVQLGPNEDYIRNHLAIVRNRLAQGAGAASGAASGASGAASGPLLELPVLLPGPLLELSVLLPGPLLELPVLLPGPLLEFPVLLPTRVPVPLPELPVGLPVFALLPMPLPTSEKFNYI